MNRSLLQPLRTRRRTAARASRRPLLTTPLVTPETRKTLAAIGALWLSFGASSSAS